MHKMEFGPLEILIVKGALEKVAESADTDAKDYKERMGRSTLYEVPLISPELVAREVHNLIARINIMLGVGEDKDKEEPDAS